MAADEGLPAEAGDLLATFPNLSALRSTEEGQTGFSTNGVVAHFVFYDRGTFWVLPLTYFDLHETARAYLFSQSAPCGPQLTRDMTWAE